MPAKSTTPLTIVHASTGAGPAVLLIHSCWGLTSSFHVYARVLATVGLVDLFNGQGGLRLRERRGHSPNAPKGSPFSAAKISHFIW